LRRKKAREFDFYGFSHHLARLGEHEMSVTKETVRFGPFAEYIAQGVKVDNIIYLSGQIGLSPEGIPAQGLIEQTKLAYANITEVLEKFGAAMGNIVDETVFLTNAEDLMGNLEEFSALRTEAYGEVPQVSQTMIQVAALAMPGLEIEIKCIAHV
jgi:2-iminobutanoate/2-iminopropanoate deaminase